MKNYYLDKSKIKLRKTNEDRTTHIWEESRMDAQR